MAEKRLKRRYDCRHYPECLDKAAKADVTLSCLDCPKYEAADLFLNSQYEFDSGAKLEPQSQDRLKKNS